MRRNRGQSVKASPAHRRRMSMDVLAATVFPYAGVGLQRAARCLVAERFEQMKQRHVARTGQSAVEEHRHGGENDAAIGVVLDLFRRLIAYPHGPVIAVPI